ncbi:MAG TPA: CHASE3 domain-containing protein [Hanamia sp.]|nr:CHASE3 domain-containing protein [Hanamia sp.]
MRKSFLNKITTRTRIGFLAAFFLLFLSYLLTYISTKKVANQDYWMNHTNEVIHNLDNIIGFITKGESAFRGYLITDDQKLLTTYDESIRNTDSTFSRLKILTIDNRRQQKNLDTLHLLINQKFQWIESIIADFSSTHKITPFLLKGDDRGITKTRNIETHIAKMKQEERALWLERSQKVSEYSGIIQVLNVLSIVIAVLLTIYSIVVYNKENKEKLLASKKADEYKSQLQKQVKELASLNTELIELRRMEKYLVTGRIARVIAHEVRNPLTNINLACEQLQSEISDNDSAKMLFTMINRNSERINQLVSDLLNSTRVAELSFSEASLNEILDATLELARDRIELKQIYVVKNYDENICKIPVDVDKMKIAFLNIIVNAVEAMEENGTLEISINNANNRCAVKISDNGRGMKKGEMDRLFEPYFTTKEKGNGLGLANTQNIILAHKGNIYAESEFGKGTSFTITF